MFTPWSIYHKFTVLINNCTYLNSSFDYSNTWSENTWTHLWCPFRSRRARHPPARSPLDAGWRHTGRSASWTASATRWRACRRGCGGCPPGRSGRGRSRRAASSRVWALCPGSPSPSPPPPFRRCSAPGWHSGRRRWCTSRTHLESWFLFKKFHTESSLNGAATQHVVFECNKTL